MSTVANVKTLFVTPGKIVSFKLVNEREQNLTTPMKLHKVQHSPTQPATIQQPSHIITIHQPTHTTTSYLHTQNLDKIKKHPS
jgi:hypothetical protein